MHELRVQRTLIAFIKREIPAEWSIMRADLRHEFALFMDAMPNQVCREHFGHMYHQRKAALVVRVARHLAALR